MTWRQAAWRYIKQYQLHRMRSISHAPYTIQLWAGRGVLEVRRRRVNIARLGYYDPATHSQ